MITQTQEQSRPVLLTIIVMVLIFMAGALAGFGLATFNEPVVARIPLLSNAVSVDDTPPEGTDLETFWEVWNLLDNRYYYDLPDDQERIYGAIKGMVNSLDDPYTVYADPEEAQIINENNTGNFEGIGAFVEVGPDGGVLITRVFEGGPAEEAGLQAGDLIVAVDDQEIIDELLGEALLLIRGESGTDVDLTVIRDGRIMEFTVTRASLEIPTVQSELLENNIGYIELFQFNAQATQRTRQAIRDLEDQGAESLIFDLRGNPGGFLSESISVADLFLGRSVVVIQRDVDGNEETFRANNGGPAEDIPLVVLIDGGSASASEIVAGAIQDHDRGTLIGQTTFGKGSVQVLQDLPDGSQLRVTYANWYTPNDNSITEVGVEPDIVVELPEETIPGEDPILDQALEYLTQNE